jgi:hypothetical protein
MEIGSHSYFWGQLFIPKKIIFFGSKLFVGMMVNRQNEF